MVGFLKQFPLICMELIEGKGVFLTAKDGDETNTVDMSLSSITINDIKSSTGNFFINGLSYKSILIAKLI